MFIILLLSYTSRFSCPVGRYDFGHHKYVATNRCQNQNHSRTRRMSLLKGEVMVVRRIDGWFIKRTSEGPHSDSGLRPMSDHWMFW